MARKRLNACGFTDSFDLSIHKRKVYNIICKWNDSKEDRDYTFVSEDLDFDPTMSIRVSNSSSLKVYLDKNNYDNYFVDVNEIKNNRI